LLFTAEFRKLQTERRRNEISHAAADLANEVPISSNPPMETFVTEQTRSQPKATPRNAQCPCGSGQKYKRCCGKNAPAVLHLV
jgi:uncharacterized protein YecA (UPF0149 family)